MSEAVVQAIAGLGSAFVLVISIGLGLTWSRVVRCGQTSDCATPADVMLVFGAEAYPDGRPSPELQARLDHAAALYRQGRVPLVLCSGGHPGARSEPRVMRASLIRLGVPAEAILIDEAGSSTRRSIAGVKRLGAGRWRTVLLISSSYHLHRILAEARRQGVGAIGSPAPSTPIMRRFAPRTRQRAREVAAAWWYALTPISIGPRALSGTLRQSTLARPVNRQPAPRRVG